MSESETMQEIWPRPKLALSSVLSLKAITTSQIENFFNAIYPNAYAVLMPSGRSALRLILIYLGLKRPDLVSIPKYSSHCIINSVGLVATPIQHFTAETKQSIVFHQWGYIRVIGSMSGIIEDSVDSLIPASGNLFPNDGRFEIISLPKVYGTLIGGLILCQHQRDADKLRQFRDDSNLLSQKHFYLRLAGQFSSRLLAYWNNIEPLNTHTPLIGLRDIWRKIQNFDTLIDDRRKKISLLTEMSIKSALPLPINRYPCCWPIPVKKWPGTNPPSDHLIRHIHGKKTNNQYQRVVPLPIHHEVSIKTIKGWIANGS